MAFSLQIKWYLTPNDTPEVEMEPAWWNAEEMRREYAFEDSGDRFLREFHLEVSTDQLRAIHQSQLTYAYQGIYVSPPWSRQNKDLIEDIEIMLESPLTFHRIVISIFEWES